MIRTCLFDMGNVLFHFSHERMCVQMGAVCGRSAADVRNVLFEGGLQHAFERGLLSEAEFKSEFERALKTEVDFEELRRACCDIFHLNEPIVAVIDELKHRSIRLVLLSNTSIWHFEYLHRRFDLLDRFDEFVVSCKVGAIKPQAAIFLAALERIGCEPGRAFYTDDLPENVARAREFGLSGEVFTDVPSLVEHLSHRGIGIGSAC